MMGYEEEAGPTQWATGCAILLLEFGKVVLSVVKCAWEEILNKKKKTFNGIRV